MVSDGVSLLLISLKRRKTASITVTIALNRCANWLRPQSSLSCGQYINTHCKGLRGMLFLASNTAVFAPAGRAIRDAESRNKTSLCDPRRHRSCPSPVVSALCRRRSASVRLKGTQAETLSHPRLASGWLSRHNPPPHADPVPGGSGTFFHLFRAYTETSPSTCS